VACCWGLVDAQRSAVYDLPTLAWKCVLSCMQHASHLELRHRFVLNLACLLHHYSLRIKSCHLLQALNDEGAGAASPVADACAAHLAALLLQDVDERGHDPGTAAAEGVADGDASAVDVDVGAVEAEQLHVGQGDDAEGLVDLVKVDVGRGPLGMR
jgi:hypothetical protein